MNMHERSTPQLLALHRETLFRLTRNGQMHAINEPGFPSPPRLWLGRTTAGNQWALRHDLPPALVTELEALCQTEPTPSDLRQPLAHTTAMKALLAEHAPIRNEYQGPAYWIPRGSVIAGAVTMINAANAELLNLHFTDLLEPDAYHEIGPVFAVIEGGHAVSVCFCSRIPGQAAEAGVNTHPDYRRRGYAAAAVSAWAAALHEQAILPLYGTSWVNHASQAIARKLGMVLYGEDWSVH